MTIQLAPKATGCLITNDDIPRLLASISAFGAQFGCGAGTAVLTLTLPYLVKKNHINISHIGSCFFISPGLGIIIGLLLSYHLRQTIITMKLSKISLSCISIFIAGILQLIIMLVTNIYIILLLNLLQFTAFGCVEGFSTIALFEMWGQRIQPWLYSKTCAYAFGGLIPSLLFRNKGFNEIYILSSILCFFPLFGLICDFIYTSIRNKKIEANSTIISHYSTFRSTSSKDNLTAEYVISMSDDFQAPQHRNSIPTILEEDFMSSEFVLIELAFENVTIKDVPKKVKDAIINILDATEYCNVTIQQRKDPYFEPNIIKTLAYATSPVVKKLTFLQSHRIPPFIPLFPPLQTLYIGFLGFIYMSLKTIFAGLLPWYIIQLNQSSMLSNQQHQHQHQEFDFLNHWNVLSLYYICSLLGSAASIPLSIWISTTTIFRLNLFFLTISSILFLWIDDSAPFFHIFLYGSIIMGLALSSTFPSLFTLLNDYGFTSDDLSVTTIILISSFGIIICPVIMSYFVIPVYGYQLIPYVCGVLGITLVICYSLFHFYIEYFDQIKNFQFNKQNNQISSSKNEYFRINKSYNTYQRAQTMLIDTKRFKFTQSSNDLQTLSYQSMETDNSYELIQQGDVSNVIVGDDQNNIVDIGEGISFDDDFGESDNMLVEINRKK